ncbi:TIGR01244 family sulfur transferase [Paraglaciecola chathamensis]|jgi:sulfide:quinone oxidoreductase|tara:strand:- start:6009 stop:7691 length:1683 start_codon:yes stop_codon:yes gene_type:complete
MMDIKRINDKISVSPQITTSDVSALNELGYKTIICNRPNGERGDQPGFDEIKREAEKFGIQCVYLPVTTGKIMDKDGVVFRELLNDCTSPVFAYCRSGTRSITLWALSSADTLSYESILAQSKCAGYDLSGVVSRLMNKGKTPTSNVDFEHAVVIVGAGAAGIAVASSLKKRDPNLDIAIIDPADVHYYQPGWTLVGGGVFTANDTVRTTSSVIPEGTTWIKAAVAAFMPADNLVLLDGCRHVKYEQLVVCPGIKLDWSKIEGLSETLGRNGVTSNYRFDLAPYTWELVKSLKGGNAVFTQPPMPIKCAGAPQKAMYLSCDYWNQNALLKQIDVDFYNAGAVLFGVTDYVPALMKYVEKYNINLDFSHQLIAVDGENKIAKFKTVNNDKIDIIEKEFDMLHVVPPQSPPNFIQVSPLADDAGWVDVDQFTLRHKKFENIYSLGDVMNAPNAKTAAAVRMQAPVVASNLLSDRGTNIDEAIYNGYGSCPLTVERGKIVLAEFGYGGKVLNSFPSWLIDGTKPSRLAWYLKEKILPPLYWKAMLRGKEWLTKPEKNLPPNSK